MSNSPLVDHVRISPNSNPRNRSIDTITIHHMAGNLSIESCGAGFADPARQASSNYGIGSDGRIGLYVEEDRRAWTSSNRENDYRAITIEVANDGGAPDWHVSDAALESLIKLCVDICHRNRIPRLNFTGDASGNLTMHKYFAATECPGPYLGGKFPHIAQEVNARLGVTVAPEKPETPKSTANTWRVQIGAYGSQEGAEARRKQAEAAGFDSYIVVVDDSLWRVQVGSYEDRASAEQLHEKLRAAGLSGLVTTLGGSPTVAPEASAPPTSDDGEVVEVQVSVLKKGATGAQVEALQALLIGYGYDVGTSGVDGSFGPATEAAVQKYKQSKGLTGGTTVGATTWAHLLGSIIK